MGNLLKNRNLSQSLMLMLVISLCHQISQDYELSQFERLLAMPISRGQYVLAQFLVLLALSLVFVTPMFLLMLALSEPLPWGVSMSLPQGRGAAHRLTWHCSCVG